MTYANEASSALGQA